MKKLLIIATVLLTISCKHKPAIQDPVPVTGDPIAEYSVNGAKQADSKSYVQAFHDHWYSSSASGHKNTQIWVRTDVLTAIVALLDYEALHGIVKPDGVRIYFSGISESSMEDNLLIVSTYYSGDEPGPNGTTIKIHTDYFEHSQSKIQNINTVIAANGATAIYHDDNDTNGALLFNTCNCDNPTPCSISTGHEILRSKAENMVKHFKGYSCQTKSEWFDLTMLDKLIQILNKEGDDGIRIYFARNLGDIDPTDKDKAEFIITTTKSFTPSGSTNSIHQDNFDCSQMAFSEGKKKLKGPGQDNGELCPSHCDGTSLP
jgi:hypothetical protein